MARVNRKRRVKEIAAERGWTRIGEGEWRELAAAIPGLTSDTLRDIELEVESPWCGIRQHTFEELVESLDAMSAVYAARPDLRTVCRREVIRAKDRARWSSHSGRVAEETRAAKAGMVEWMLVWLSDPSLFPAWAEIALKTRAQQPE
jgi:hypothetical protein